MSDWHNSPHNAKWMQDVKQAHAADPEGFKARGKKKPGHFFEGMPLQRQPHALPEELTRLVNKPQAVAPTESTPAPAAQKAAPAISPKDLSHLPASLRAKFGGGQ
jgi:hypothetical protein